MHKHAEAIKEWTSLLGEFASSEEIESENTFNTSQSAITILQPSNPDEIIACLEIARKYDIALQPVSSNKNWGYGSSQPAYKSFALLSLHRLSNIIDYEDKLGTVTIEPGVTQQQLYDFLTKNGGRFWMDCTGSSPECSVVGNTMERGFGHTPYSDHAAHIICLEVILPNGDVITTGFGRFENSLSQKAYAAGVGPSINQLFVQSNLGIITKMTIALMPAPEYFEAYFFSIDNHAKLPALIDALLPLRQDGTIQSALHLGNSYRVLSSIRQYPWEETNETPLPEDILDKFSKSWDFGPWNGSAGIYGTKQQVNLTKKRLKKKLAPHVNKIRFINDNKLLLAEKTQHIYKSLTGTNLPEMLKLLKPVYGMMKGIPSKSVLKSTYWRQKGGIPAHMNPGQDGCGLIWCSPVAPLLGIHAKKMNDIVTDILPSHGFEPGMTMTLLNGQTLENIISISYDRKVDGEDQRALECYFALADALANAGYYPYRLGIHAMQHTLDMSSENYNKFMRTIKHALDPDDIISPGRYII